LGPEGGFNGGEILAEGSPEEIARSARSYTGKYLKQLFGRARAGRAATKGRASAGLAVSSA
jgi:excinuclease ABC subunit A